MSPFKETPTSPNAQYLNTPFFYLLKELDEIKINGLREEEDVLTRMGGVPSAQNGAWSQPLLRLWGRKTIPTPLSFYVPKTLRVGEAKIANWTPARLAVRKSQGSRAPGTAGCQLAPLPDQNWVTPPGQALLLPWASASWILKSGSWTPSPRRVGVRGGNQPAAGPGLRCACGGTSRSAPIAPSGGAAGAAGEARGDARGG